MALTSITNRTFGTGDADTLSKETSFEPAVDVACKNGLGEIEGWVVGNYTKSVRTTEYGSATDANTAPTSASATNVTVRKTVSASNEDFVKVTLETRELVSAGG